MAFITKTTDPQCYSCGKQCINVEFCSAGASYDNDDVGSQGISISRNIRVSITANPEFWGFSGVLISGWATYTNGYYDFFDGHDEDHSATKECDGITYGPFKNEQRPDVFYRSVYDPDTRITKHYGSAGTLEGSGAGRGGAEVYLIDRQKGLVAAVSSDGSSCENNNPVGIFKQFPENYGWGNKINFNTKIYKNLSGAWRLTSLENCYPEARLYKPSGYLIDCSGNEKQNIRYKQNQYLNYEPSRLRGSGESDYYDYVTKCYPDGAVAGKYSGRISEIRREDGDGGFIKVSLYYGSTAPHLPASSLKNGMQIGLKNDISGIFNNVYTITNVSHQNHGTTVSLVGTSSGNIQPDPLIPIGVFTLDIDGNGHWVAFNTYDPQTCCGLNAYGVSDEDKSLCGDINYHVDFRRVFNNPKNLRQSNRDREWRYDYGLFDTINVASSSISGRLDRSYISVSGVEVSGRSYGYPLIVSNSSIVVATGNTSVFGYPLFEKELPYYGNFFDTDRCDNLKRFDQAISRGRASNATCYSKHATLEIFPDCITQYDSYEECETTTDIYVTNRVPRLAFVYRGCDFNDDCSFDSSGLPLGGWKDHGSVPTGIENLKRQLAGQEVHMFINLGTAWGGRKPGSPCQCDCEGETEGQIPPEHVMIPSPLTFTSLPNFDLDPTGYGCQDPRYQYQTKTRENNGIIGASGSCDPLPTSEYACKVRQPYVTYGYIMNLCGKESNNRRDVIASGFAKLHQQKTYTNANSTGNILEPMFWNVIAPSPSPFGGSGIWSSGTSSRSDGVGNFTQTAGSGYGFWGLADSNKQIVAPYFTTQKGSYVCCSNTGEFLDYNATGTITNLGWPKSKVPFLIELEVDDSCVGCVSANMKDEPLVLEIEGLSGQFIWNTASATSSRYGHNYCKYGPVSGGKSKTEPPSFTCASGFASNVCVPSQYGQYYVGNTCQCVGNELTLNPVRISGTDIVIGWTSNTLGGAAGLVEISGCNDYGSRYLDASYLAAEGNGYRIFAQFDLACPGMHRFIMKPDNTDLSYNGNPVSTLWNNTGGCSHHYPARIGSNTTGGNYVNGDELGDLDLQTTLYLIAERNVPIFRNLSDRGLKFKDFSTCVTLSDFGVNGIFDTCPGDNVYTYGCSLTSSGGTPFFYGCLNPDGYGPSQYIECTGTMCSTCPTGVESGDVTCICGAAVGYEGIIPRQQPPNYQFNECYCLCKEPTLLAIYTATATGLVLSSGSSASCGTAYWASTDSVPITMLSCLPPNPYLGIKLASWFNPIKSIDWYDWSHGVNALVNGIRHELNAPYLANENDSIYVCTQLSRGPNPGSIIDCSYTGCASNTNVGNKTCGTPIYSTGSFPTSDITVRKKKCHPEVAIVTKIDCLPSSGYRLYLSREYHEHDRKWYTRFVQQIPGGGEEDICIAQNVGAYFYDDGTTSGCQQIPYASLVDTVTPVSNPPCSINPSSGLYLQDYKYEDSSFPSGSFVWNYFNLFYNSGNLPTLKNGYLQTSLHRDSLGNYTCTGTPIALASTTTIFTKAQYDSPAGFNGIFATTGKHSCVQDSTICGGELWCNKLFFPRHSYKAGTRIAAFGAPTVCTSNSEFKTAFNLDGYREQGSLINGASDIFAEQKLRFIDWCNDALVEESVYDIGIDDNSLVVDDYLPLIGVIHPGWRFTSDVKSCTVGGSGCQDKIPVHTENTILAGIHQPKTFTANGFDSMGYYLDRFGVSYKNGGLVRASGTDQCLFNPFKIFIDVECSLNRIARKQFSYDPPTYLQGVQEWPAEACLGMIGTPPCNCTDTECSFAGSSKGGTCTKFLVTSYVGDVVEGEYYICSTGSPSCECGVSGELLGATLVDGRWVDIDKPVAAWFHPSVFTDTDLDGTIQPPKVCTYGGGYGSPPSSSVYPIASTGLANWKLNTCDGRLYIVENTEAWTRLFQCNSNQYLNPHPASVGGQTECGCKTDITKGICTATVGCADFTSCACNPIGSGGFSPSGTFWRDDCGCENFVKIHGPCLQDSVIKWTITEAV